jgi:hypothetical protein
MVALVPLLTALIQVVPPAPRVAGPEHVQVPNVKIADANDHAGKIIGLDIEGVRNVVLYDVTTPAGIVIDGAGRQIETIRFSPETSALYVYDLTITGIVGASHTVWCEPQASAIDWDDPQPDEGQVGLSYFRDCLFGGKQVLNYNVTYLEGVPGLYRDASGGGRTACKWWVQPKAPRNWIFSGCVFWASQEHALYFHWAHSVRVESCIFEATGGTSIQSAWRYGRPPFGNRYYGNPSMSPPLEGDFIVHRCEFRDRELWSREASEISVFGWPQGTVWIDTVTVSGARSAAALTPDSWKGAYWNGRGGRWVHVSNHGLVGPGGVRVDGEPPVGAAPGQSPQGPFGPVDPGATGRFRLVPPDTEVEQAGYAFQRVILRDVTVLPGPHDREQIMLNGFASAIIENVTVDSHKPALAIGSRYGGSFSEGPWELRGETPSPVTWNGSQYISAGAMGASRN